MHLQAIFRVAAIAQDNVSGSLVPFAVVLCDRCWISSTVSERWSFKLVLIFGKWRKLWDAISRDWGTILFVQPKFLNVLWAGTSLYHFLQILSLKHHVTVELCTDSRTLRRNLWIANVEKMQCIFPVLVLSWLWNLAQSETDDDGLWWNWSVQCKW